MLVSNLPSLSGSSLYPTLFLSTGTTMPAPWNVFVTTYIVKRVSIGYYSKPQDKSGYNQINQHLK